MVRKYRLIWTYRAQIERKEILQFWIEHNKSAAYSIKLNRLLKEKLKLLCSNPFIGRKTDIDDNIRIKVIRDYHVFYQIDNFTITILSVWDSRQDAETLII